MKTQVERTGGRPPGSKNRYGKDLRQLILEAMELEGDEIGAQMGEGRGGALEFVRMIARSYPEKFVDLIKASMPKQVDMKFEGDTAALLTRFLESQDERRGKLIELKRRFENERETFEASA